MQNGHKRAAFLDVARGVFVTSEGKELELRPVRAMIYERIVNSKVGEPQIPMVEVTIAGKHKRLEPNPADPDYLKAMSDWAQEKAFGLAFYLFTAGIKGQPDKAFVDEYRVYFPQANDVEMKYYWVVAQVPDGDIEALMEAVTGQTIPTQAGLELAAETFQGESERPAD